MLSCPLRDEDYETFLPRMLSLRTHSAARRDPIELLEIVKHRLVTMHASDRFLRLGHTLDELRQVEDSAGYAAILSRGVVGNGLSNYSRIFQILGEVGYQGWISVEDGINGFNEMRESAEFLRSFMRS